MIDMGDSIINYCIKPMSFLILKESDVNYEFNSTDNIEKSKIKLLLINLLEKHTESDYIVLFKSIKYLKQVQKNKCLREFYATILSFENYDSTNYLKMLLDGAPFLDQNLKIKFLESAEKIIDQINENEEYPLFLSELATQYVILKEFNKAIVLFEESISVLKSYEGDQRDKFAKVYSNLGAAHWYTGNFEPMRECYERAYEIYLDLCGEFHSSTALALHNLALIKVMEEDYAESLTKFQMSLDITLRISGNSHPDAARAYSNMGSACLKLAEHKRAFDLFNLALTIDKQVFHQFHPSLGLDYDDLGDALYQDGQLSKAREYYEHSRAIFLKNYGLEYPHVKLLDQKLKQLNDL